MNDVQTTPASRPSDRTAEVATDPLRLLRLYLRDHDAAAAGGLQLLRRSSASNAESTFGRTLGELVVQVEQDAAVLRRIATRLDVGPDPVKRAAAWVGVRLGALKLNARLVRYSPLSRVYELEGLMRGVRAKRALWRSLQQVADVDTRLDKGELERMEQRADEQLVTLDELHERAVELAFVATG